MTQFNEVIGSVYYQNEARKSGYPKQGIRQTKLMNKGLTMSVLYQQKQAARRCYWNQSSSETICIGIFDII